MEAIMGVQTIAKFVALIGCTAISMAAMAAPPSISVPSTPNAEDKVLISGSNLSPNTFVRIQITVPGGVKTKQVESVDSDGNFELEYVPSTPGGYLVKVYDKKGKLVGKGNFGFIR